MQLADRIAIPALIVTSIGVLATLYGAYKGIKAANRASRERRDQSLLPVFNDTHHRGLPNRRRFIFMEETNWPHIPTEWIPMGAYGPRQLPDVVD